MSKFRANVIVALYVSTTLGVLCLTAALGYLIVR